MPTANALRAEEHHPPTLLRVLAGARALRERDALPRTRCAL